MAAPYVGDSNYQLANILKIVSKGMVYDNLSTMSPMWEYIFGMKKDNPEGRELRYSVRTELGYPAVGAMSVNGAQFHGGVRAQLKEAIAYHKKFGATIEVENTTVELATKDFAAYGMPIAEEVEAKGIALARDLSRQMFSDGTGIIGEVTSATANTPTNYITVVVDSASTDRGFIGWFHKGDRIVSAQDGGTNSTSVAGGSACSYFKVESVVRSTNTIILGGYNSSDTLVNASTLSGNDIAAGDNLFRLACAGTAAGQAGITANMTSFDGTSTNEYSTCSIEMCGLEALASAANIKVHGLQHSSDVSGTRKDVGAVAIDSQDFQEAMSEGEINFGAGRYVHDEAFMANETYDAFVESRETDRRFNSTGDSDRGAGEMGFVYRGKKIKFRTDEFCPKTRIWIPPKGDVLQYHGTDFQPVQPKNASEWHLKPGTSTYYDVAQMYMSGLGVLVCVHPAAVISLSNFTV